MSNFGKPDPTGRSSGKLHAQEGKLVGPPKGEPWAWLPRDLVASPAWCGMSIHCRRFVDFLMVEHCNHAGRENGKLQATYDQLVRQGIPRKRIAGAIREAVARGLVVVTRHGGLYGAVSCRTPSLYRLTWIGCIKTQSTATNEWKSITEKKIPPVPCAGTAAMRKKSRKVA